MGQPNESTVSQASISARAEALEKKEAELATTKEVGGEKKEPDVKDIANDAAKVKADKEAADKQAAEASKTGKLVKEKKEANDPEEMRKWTTRTAQENSKLRKEMAEIKEAQEKTYKLLASLSKKPIDYKELAKNPEALEKFVEDEREAIASEYKEQVEKLATEAKEKDTLAERIKREHDSENYPEWKRLYPQIVKLAVGPTGQGDSRIDYTKPAGEVLDSLYELALSENPKEQPVTNNTGEKTFTEAEVKAMVADMVAKEKETIAKSSREEAMKEAQEALKHEAAGSTVASTGKGGGRIPTDHLAAFKQMTLAQQREFLISQQQNNQ